MKECILLVPNNIKKDIIKKRSKKYYNYNIKFMSLEEFTQKYTFTYDEKTIYYLMKEYNIKYSTALVYLNNIQYISDKIDNNKMNKLKEIKKYLDNNKLLIYDKHFVNYALNKKIYIYGYHYINKYYKKILNNFNYQIIKEETLKYHLEKIYYADYIDDEVIFVSDQITNLLKNNIKLNNIKLIIGNEYKEVINRIFKLYNIPINIKKNSVYSTLDCKKVLNDLNKLDSVLEIIDDNTRNKIIKVLNKYSFINDKEKVRELIINDLKNTYIDNEKEGIKVININDNIEEDDYVFWLGFNKENIPLWKDNEYFSDKEKEILGVDTSNTLNIKEKENIIEKINSIKNLTISYKLYDSNINYTKTDLLENIEEVKIKNNTYSNSNLLNKIILTKKLDNLVKYNIKEEDLDLLYSNYTNIPYLKYDNSYKIIDKNKLYIFLKNKLTLAYTSFDNYNRCKFKYYLSNILKLNIINNDFPIIMGNVCHYLLSSMDNHDFEINKYFDDYISNERKLSKREQYFLNNIKEEMIFVIDTIKKQHTYTKFDKKKYEEMVLVNKDKEIKVTFMGVIDKLLYKEEDNITYLVVIDYKTGNIDIKLSNIKYGIDMQLPIYLYLSSKMDLKNINIIGFYLQKLLNTNLDNTKDYITARENNLKLEGYSINNEQLLSIFDTTYNDSKLIKSMKTSSKGFYSYSKVLEEDKIKELINETEIMIDKTIDNILTSDFKIDPKVIDSENVSCKFCEYKDICYRRENDLTYINREREEEND